MQNIFSTMQQAFNQEMYLSYQNRIKNLTKIENILIQHQPQICSAINLDFGHRNDMLTIISDIISSLNAIRYCKKNLKKWMRPEKRKKGPLLAHGKLKIQYQPLGVVGIIVPWNFPLNLTITPLAYAIAAGNRAMLKLSELTPNFNALIVKLFANEFPENEIAFILGDATIAKEFASLPFNHLFFTGSSSTGKKIMSYAAENLTPITLELGGKSPAIICHDASITYAAQRIVYGKTLNAGQVCIAPDYLLVPKNLLETLIIEIKNQFQSMFPNINDFTSIISQNHFNRLNNLINDAKAHHSTIINCSMKDCQNPKSLPLHLIINPELNSPLMTEEIFGPILPIITYENIQEAINFVNQKPRPLALYIFSNDKKIQNHILNSTIAGGVTINDTIMHIAADDAPFGGVGHSGMGAYHAIEGFKTFSHAKTIFSSNTLFNPAKILNPPYNSPFLKKIIAIFTK